MGSRCKGRGSGYQQAKPAGKGYVPVTERNCYKCGKKGHLAGNCPTNQSANEVGKDTSQGTQPDTGGAAINLGQLQPDIGEVTIEPPKPGDNESTPYRKCKDPRRKPNWLRVCADKCCSPGTSDNVLGTEG